MLLELGLRNFKAFGDDIQKAALSHITLIYGPNSGGKSSIIQALLMLKQSRGDDYEMSYSLHTPGGKLVTRGEYVDLGSFASLIHRHDVERKLSIAVSYPGIGYSEIGLLHADKIISEMTFTSTEHHIPSDMVGLKYQMFHDRQVLLDAEWEYTLDDQADPYRAKRYSISGIDVCEELIDISEYGFLPYPYVPGLMPEVAVNWEQASSRPRLVELVRRLEENLGPDLMRLVRSISSRMSYDHTLDSIIYLGPLRSYPERIYTVSGSHRISTGVRGEFTPNILYNNLETIGKANYWFERFGIPYDLAVNRFGDMELAGEYVSIALVDKYTGTLLTLADVGFGINQLLPVIVEGVSVVPESFLRPEETTICVEQPEIHLHPRLQAEVADLMIETSRGEHPKQWIVETHSELLTRRIQRRIREGKVNPKEISVLYVDPDKDGDGSSIVPLKLDQDGRFLDEWPDGFFDDGMKELLGY